MKSYVSKCSRELKGKRRGYAVKVKSLPNVASTLSYFYLIPALFDGKGEDHVLTAVGIDQVVAGIPVGSDLEIETEG